MEAITAGVAYPRTWDMPDWLLAPVCLIALVGFIAYAWRQRMRVPPDRNNRNIGPSQNDFANSWSRAMTTIEPNAAICQRRSSLELTGWE